MKRFLLCAFLLPLLAAAGPAAKKKGASLERGRYLAKVGGCNDCHTPGYTAKGGNVPESEWLSGDTVGWNGPWGTTYATNLRTRLASMTEDQWVAYARQLKARPPMPWYTVNVMAEEDLRLLYQFVRHLGPNGNVPPVALPPGQEPPKPYFTFVLPPKT